MKYLLLCFIAFISASKSNACPVDGQLSGAYHNGYMNILIHQDGDSFSVYLSGPLLEDTFTVRYHTARTRKTSNIHSDQPYSVMRRIPLISSYTPLGSDREIIAMPGNKDLPPGFRQAQLVLKVRHQLHTPQGNRNSEFLYGFQKLDNGALLYIQLPGFRSQPIIDTFLPRVNRTKTPAKSNSISPVFPIAQLSKLQTIIDRWADLLQRPDKALPVIRTRRTYYSFLDKDWDLGKGYDEKMFVLSMQGLLNREKATLFLVYPDNWNFNNTPDLLHYYRDRRKITFTQLDSSTLAEQLLRLPETAEIRKEYILWDNKTFLSLHMAQTLGALLGIPVVTRKLEPLVRKYGFKAIADLSGPEWQEFELHKMRGPAYLSCNRMIRRLERQQKKFLMNDSAILCAGEQQNRTAMTDYGFANRLQFFCLEDYKICTDNPEPLYLDSLLQTLKPFSTVCGWHIYSSCSSEENFVTTVSAAGHTMLGLASFPNGSFCTRIPADTGFRFRNNPTPAAEIDYLSSINKDTILLAFVQTDGIGLGAWNDPLRGTFPYSWDVSGFLDYYPSYIEFYYGTATPMDYFLGAPLLMYSYPRSVPETCRLRSYQRQNQINRVYDIQYGQVYEPSTLARPNPFPAEPPNLDLPEDLVREIWRHSELKGFLNGYDPASTFARDSTSGKPALSFAYYLDGTIGTQRAVDDFNQLLASLKSTTGLGLVIHVRESNSLQRIVDFIRGVQQTYPVKAVQIDALLETQSRKFNYREHFLDFSK